MPALLRSPGTVWLHVFAIVNLASSEIAVIVGSDKTRHESIKKRELACVLHKIL